MFAASFRFGTMFQQLHRTGGTLLSFLLSLVTESLLALGIFFFQNFLQVLIQDVIVVMLR
jgi:hypothetical protein